MLGRAAWASEIAHGVAAEAEGAARAGVRRQGDLPRLARLEADGRAGGGVEPHAPGSLAVEPEGGIGLGEVVVTAHLDRPVAGVSDHQDEGRCAVVEHDLAGGGDDFAGYHPTTARATPPM